MVRSSYAKAGIEAMVIGPAMMTCPRVTSKNRATSATYSRPLLPSQGSLPLSPSWPRWPIAHMARTSAKLFSFRSIHKPNCVTLTAGGALAKIDAETLLMAPRARSLPHTDESHRIRAIGLMALATLCFAALDATGKYLIVKQGVPVIEVSWLRFVGH